MTAQEENIARVLALMSRAQEAEEATQETNTVPNIQVHNPCDPRQYQARQLWEEAMQYQQRQRQHQQREHKRKRSPDPDPVPVTAATTLDPNAASFHPTTSSNFCSKTNNGKQNHI